MGLFDRKLLEDLHKPSKNSHKGENGKLLIIGGSKLFHSGAIWPLEVASRIVDMVYFSSIDENNEVVKERFQNGIVVPRGKIDEYIKEADAILIGPGMPREEGIEQGDDDTEKLTTDLLLKYPNKKWVIDGGSLQVIEPQILPKNAIVTPHHGEFEKLFWEKPSVQNAEEMAKKFGVVILLKGEIDVVSDGKQTVEVPGGNPGMTKGGTGDVLAGLVAALYTNNYPFLASVAGSFLNKAAGDALFKRVGIYFNATDLANEIPGVMKSYI